MTELPVKGEKKPYKMGHYFYIYKQPANEDKSNSSLNFEYTFTCSRIIMIFKTEHKLKSQWKDLKNKLREDTSI